MTISDLIAAEAAAAEQNPDAPIKVGSTITRGHSQARTLQVVRLNDDELAALATLAAARGAPVSTLARDLLLGLWTACCGGHVDATKAANLTSCGRRSRTKLTPSEGAKYSPEYRRRWSKFGSYL